MTKEVPSRIFCCCRTWGLDAPCCLLLQFSLEGFAALRAVQVREQDPIVRRCSPAGSIFQTGFPTLLYALSRTSMHNADGRGAQRQCAALSLRRRLHRLQQVRVRELACSSEAAGTKQGHANVQEPYRAAPCACPTGANCLCQNLTCSDPGPSPAHWPSFHRA